MTKLTTILIPTDVTNLNGRSYPREVMHRMLMNQLPNAKFVGTIGYENSRDIPLEHVAFECANLTLAAGGVACDVTVLDTPDGVLLQHLLERDNIVFRPFGEGLLADDGKLTDYKLVSTAAISKKHDSFE